MDGPAAAELAAAIRAAGGAIPFDRFMHEALYGVGGFYARPSDDGGGRAGRRGDFLTAVEVGPLFGAVIARWLDAEWQRLGRPEPFRVIEVGAGPGTLARSVHLAAPSCVAAMEYVAVEISAVQRAHHPDHVRSVGDMPTEPMDGVIIANELLDNLPFRLAVFDDGWREAFVVEADGRFAELLSAPFDPVPSVLPVRAAHGSRAPLQEEAARWVDQARGALRSGSVLVFDYMSTTTANLAMRPYRDWLRTFRHHQRGDHPLSAPGSQDITAEVALDQLPEPDAVRTQAQWLGRWGIDELVAEGRRIWGQEASRPGLEAMRMRSRIREAEALLDPAGLGSFFALEWRVG